MSNYQKIFKRAAVDRMRDQLRAGITLENYFKEFESVDEADCLPSTIEVRAPRPVLSAPQDDPVATDLENAIVLHGYYPELDETQASDPRLWAYLSHVDFRAYTMARWGLDGSYADLNDESKQKAINYVLEHWFTSGNDRDLRRHAIARLWWAAHLTRAPWEKDPEFFGHLVQKDPYHYTKILLQTQDIYQQVLERAMGRSDRILISVLDYLGNHAEFAQSRAKIRSLMKELNLAYGTRKLITLNPEQLAKLVEKTAEEVSASITEADSEVEAES